jgi:hypothetical protein
VVLHQISTGWLTNLILIIMKNSKAILLAIFASAFAVLTVVNMSLVSPKSAGENTLDMLEIMTRAFDESEGGEGGACVHIIWFSSDSRRAESNYLCYYMYDEFKNPIEPPCGIAYGCYYHKDGGSCQQSDCNEKPDESM